MRLLLSLAIGAALAGLKLGGLPSWWYLLIATFFLLPLEAICDFLVEALADAIEALLLSHE